MMTMLQMEITMIIEYALEEYLDSIRVQAALEVKESFGFPF